MLDARIRITHTFWLDYGESDMPSHGSLLMNGSRVYTCNGERPSFILSGIPPYFRNWKVGAIAYTGVLWSSKFSDGMV